MSVFVKLSLTTDPEKYETSENIVSMAIKRLNLISVLRATEKSISSGEDGLIQPEEKTCQKEICRKVKMSQ